MYEAHDSLWKGFLTLGAGIFASIYGLAGKFLFAADPSAYSMVHVDSSPLTLADISTFLGFATTLVGGLYSWYLVQKAKREKQERDSREQDQLSRVKVTLAEGLAAIKLEHAKIAATIGKASEPREVSTDGSHSDRQQ